MAQKTYEEYSVGEKFVSYARTMTEADLVNYTNLAGLKLPLFIDVEYCKKHSMFKERVFPGLLTASIAAGMLEDILGKYTLAALGLDKFKFKAPVKIGDTVRALARISSLDRDKRRAALDCFVSVGDKVVLEGEALVLVPSRA